MDGGEHDLIRPPVPRSAGGGFAWGRAALAVVVAAAAFCAVAGLVRRAAPWPSPDDSLLQRQIDAYDAQAESIDLVFFGSSVLYRGIDPAVVDRRLAEHGFHVRSFNFARPAMRPFETDDLLRRVVRTGRRLPRWTVVEVAAWDPRHAGDSTLRDVSWHSDRQTARAVRISTRIPIDGPLMRDLVWRHVRAWGLRFASVGHGPPTLRALLPRPATRDDAVTPGRGVASPRTWNGHTPFPSSGPLATEGFQRRRTAFLSDPDGYRVRVDALAAAPRPVLSETAARALDEQARFLARNGSSPVHLVGPALDRAPRVPGGPGRPLLLAFDDPLAFPELFAPAHRFDEGHLNASGAALWSRRVADALADVLRAAEQ